MAVGDDRIRAKEHATFEVDADRFLVDGHLQLYEETQQRNYFQIRAKGSKLVFQAGGFIGLIPVNDRVTIEVVPRTPIENLDRILRVAGVQPEVITRISRSYSDTNEDLSLTDVLADELVNALARIALDGRMKTYESTSFVGGPRSGRIVIRETLRARAAHPGRFAVASNRFERTNNNSVNAVLRLAIEKLASDIRRAKPRRGWKERLLRLNEGWQMFARVDGRAATRSAIESLRHNTPQGLSEPYCRALAVGVAVLSGRGPSVVAEDGPLRLSSLIYNISTAFENYVRNVLRDEPSLDVQDGNLSPPAGAERKLFSNPASPGMARMSATPDIVFGPLARAWAAADVKYKIVGDAPDREDLNQVITYAVSYSVEKCVLFYPASKSLRGLLDCGLIGNKRVYCYGMDLAAADIEAEETAMRVALRSLRPTPA